MGIGYALLVSAEQTAGEYELMKFVIPTGLGPPMHMHTREDECYLILEGEFEVTVGEEVFTATPGTYLHLPRNIRHGITNVGDDVGSFLCWVIPGNLGPFFAQLTQPWPADAKYPPMLTEEDIQKLMSLAQEFGITLLA